MSCHRRDYGGFLDNDGVLYLTIIIILICCCCGGFFNRGGGGFFGGVGQ